MPLHPALKTLIAAKMANARAPQWRLPIEEVRASFRTLWTPTITGPIVEVASVEDKTLDTVAGPVKARVFTPGDDGPSSSCRPLRGWISRGSGTTASPRGN